MTISSISRPPQTTFANYPSFSNVVPSLEEAPNSSENADAEGGPVHNLLRSRQVGEHSGTSSMKEQHLKMMGNWQRSHLGRGILGVVIRVLPFSLYFPGAVNGKPPAMHFSPMK